MTKELPSDEILKSADLCADLMTKSLSDVLDGMPLPDAMNVAHFGIAMVIANYLKTIGDNLTPSQKEKAITHIAGMALAMISKEDDEKVEVLA